MPEDGPRQVTGEGMVAGGLRAGTVVGLAEGT